MRRISLLMLLGVLLSPLYSFAEPVPPEGDCACNTLQLPNDGPTGSELLSEICPDGKLAPDGRLIADETKILVRLNDPRREYRVERGAENNDLRFCSIAQGVDSTGELGLTEEQFQACVDTIEESCLFTRPIPTISEWGLIAMAGVLGLVGIAVIRRKRLAA